MRIDFEYVESNKIVVRENFKETDIVDNGSYAMYKSFNSREVKLIPEPYYKLLSSDNVGPISYNFDELFWEKSIGPRLTNEINKVLFPFQKVAIYKMIKSKRCMNAASPGLGKSIQGLSCISFFKTPVKGDLIICPSYLRSNWYNEVKTWLPNEIDNTIVIDKTGKKELEDSLLNIVQFKGIKIVSYGTAATLFCELKRRKMKMNDLFNTILCDESHFIKNTLTKRFKNLSIPIKNSRQVFLLTGTPSPNYNKELYAQFHLIRPDIFDNYMLFTERYSNGHYDIFNHYDDRGASNVAELAYMMKKLILRMRREDHIEELPEVQRIKVIVKPDTVSKKFLSQKKAFLKKLEQINEDKNAKFVIQSLASEMFRETSVLKIQPVLHYLSNYCQTMDLEKTILFCKHQNMMLPVVEFLKEQNFDFITISGQTDMKERPNLIKKFLNEPQCMFAVLTTGSCATGLNIVPIRRMIFLELDWSPSTLDQCECRIRRIGGATHLQYFYIICEDTLDEMVFNKIKKKTELVNSTVDDGKNYGDFEFVNLKRKIGDT